MAISRSQTGKTVSLKPPKHLQHRVIKASSPLEKKKKKTPFLPATKKNFKKYKPKKIKATKSLTASQLWKFAPDVKS
jgi:hypothetical protein